MICEGVMEFWRPAERPAVMIVGPTRSGGPTIMTKGRSKGRQNSIGPDPNHVITIITTSRFSYRFLCLHPDIYCLGTKVHWPNSPGTKDHILGTRDHWLSFYWSRDQNGRGPWAKWKKNEPADWQTIETVKSWPLNWKQTDKLDIHIVVVERLNGRYKTSPPSNRSIDRTWHWRNAAASLNTFNDVTKFDVIDH